MVAGPCHVGRHDYTDQLGRNCALWLSLHRDVFHPVCGLEPQQDLLCLRLHVCDFGIALSRYCVRQHYLHLHPPERGGLQVAVAVVHQLCSNSIVCFPVYDPLFLQLHTDVAASVDRTRLRAAVETSYSTSQRLAWLFSM